MRTLPALPTALPIILLLLMCPLVAAPASYALPTVECQDQEATIVGTEGDDDLEGTTGDDVIWAAGGNDQIVAHGGDDVICGGDGNDSIVLDGAGRVDVVGGPGGDRLHFAVSDRERLRGTVSGGPGSDYALFFQLDTSLRLDLRSGEATFGRSSLRVRYVDTVYGTSQPDVISGSHERDRVISGGGKDVVRLRGGADMVRGKAGRDIAYGGPGTDRCIAEVRHDCEN